MGAEAPVVDICKITAVVRCVCLHPNMLPDTPALAKDHGREMHGTAVPDPLNRRADDGYDPLAPTVEKIGLPEATPGWTIKPLPRWSTSI